MDASQRPSANQLLHHHFIKQVKKVGSNFSVASHLSEASRVSSHPLLTVGEHSDRELHCHLGQSQLQLCVDKEESNIEIKWEFEP